MIFLGDVFSFYVKLFAKSCDISEMLPQIAERLNLSDTFHNVVAIDRTTLKCVYKDVLNVILQFYSGNMLDHYQRINHMFKQNSNLFDLLYLIKIYFIENHTDSSWEADMDLFVLWLTVYFLQNGQHKVLPSIGFFFKNESFNYSAQYESPQTDLLELFFQFFNFYSDVDLNEIICPNNIGSCVNTDCAYSENRVIRIKEQFSNQTLTSSVAFRNVFEFTIRNTKNMQCYMTNTGTTNYSMLMCIIRDKTLLDADVIIESKRRKSTSQHIIEVCPLNKEINSIFYNL